MLKRNQITKLQAGTEEWLSSRLGKFTSSDIHLLMAVKGIGETGLDYIRRKVCEKVTGQSDEKEYGFIESLAYGIRSEMDAIKDACMKNKWHIVVNQTCVMDGELYSSTPDSVIIIDETPDGYIVETLEVKCPMKYHIYLKQRECATPKELKQQFPNYYWQVIDQMSVCGANVGHFFTYNSKFPIGKRGHQITFKKVELWDDFNLLKERKKEASEKFSKMYDNLIK